VLAAVGTIGNLAAEGAYGQAEEAAPPAQGTEPGERPGDPADPEGSGPAPVLPLPPALRPGPAPMRGSHCDHEQEGVGV
jgi:hypothetical protein